MSMEREAPKIIALDYDGTCTTHINFWTLFIEAATKCGFRVLLVTMRTPEEAQDIAHSITTRVERVICTSRKAKIAFLQDLGIHPAIWIDDMPQALFQDFS